MLRLDSAQEMRCSGIARVRRHTRIALSCASLLPHISYAPWTAILWTEWHYNSLVTKHSITIQLKFHPSTHIRRISVYNTDPKITSFFRPSNNHSLTLTFTQTLLKYTHKSVRNNRVWNCPLLFTFLSVEAVPAGHFHLLPSLWSLIKI